METERGVRATSLDAVDINSLPTSQRHSYGGAVELCGMSNLDSKTNKRNEVVIKANDKEQGLNDPVIKTVTCHICDIRVPEVYFIEHKSNYLHKFYIKLADIALKRQLQYVDKKYINENNKKISSKYFCVECSIVINSEDETSHKRSTAHRNSVSLEIFLNEFQKFYIQYSKDAVDNIRNDIRTKLVEESISSSEQENLFDETNDEMSIKNSSINLDEQKITSTETVTNKKKAKTECRREDVKETKGNEYSEILPDELKTKSYSIKDLKEGEVFLEFHLRSNNNVFKVPQYCVEAIVSADAATDCCMICNETFARENRLIHIKSDLHDKNWRVKLVNKNCIRKINKSLYNCMLCNQYFNDHALHVNSNMHRTTYRNKLVSTGLAETEDNSDCNKEKQYNNSEEYIYVLEFDNDTNLTDTNKNIAAVIKETTDSLALIGTFYCLHSFLSPSVDLRSNILCDICNDWVSVKEIRKHRRGTKHVFNTMSDYHYLLQYLDEDNLICKICKVTVSNVQEGIVDHFAKSNHIKKCGKLLKTESMIKIDEKIYYCVQCKEYILHKNEYLHIESKKHIGLKEEIVEVGLIETDVTDKRNGSTGRSNDPADAGDTTGAASRNTGEVGSGKATDNVEGINVDNPVSKAINILSGLPKIEAYKSVDEICFVLEGDKSGAAIEEIRMLKSLLNHSISLGK